MKKYFLLPFLVLALFSCRKSTGPLDSKPGTVLPAILSQLRDSLSLTDFQALDTTTAYLTPQLPGQPDLVRLGFRGMPLSSDFVLVQVDTLGVISGGSIVHLDNSDPGNPAVFNGNILISSLARQVRVQSVVENGYISAYHPGLTARITTLGTKSVDVVPASAGGEVLPEVVVVGYINGGESTTEAAALLTTMMGPSSNGVIYSATNGGSASGSGGGTAANGSTSNVPVVAYTPLIPGATPGQSGILLSVSLLTEVEYTDNLTVVDITKVFNCFDAVSSKGATYTVQLCADVPVNGNPEASMNLIGGVSAGHTFLVATKTNGTNSVTQAFGFYPQTDPSVWAAFSPIPSAIKDNGNKEINAGITMTVDSLQFARFKATAIGTATSPYMLASNNCSDYALNAFNSMRNPASALTPDPFVIYLPGNATLLNPNAPPTTVSIKNSPQMLFALLNQMKTSGGAEAPNIVIDQTHNTKSPPSHGQCN